MLASLFQIFVAGGKSAAAGDRQAAADLLPLIYDELRQLAAARMAAERPGQTLQPTAIVQEAYLRLIGDHRFDGREYFFTAAAEAMRRILFNWAPRPRPGQARRRLVAAPPRPDRPGAEIARPRPTVRHTTPSSRWSFGTGRGRRRRGPCLCQPEQVSAARPLPGPPRGQDYPAIT